MAKIDGRFYIISIVPSVFMMTVLIFNVQNICKSRVNVQRGFSAFAEYDAIKITGSVQIKLLLRTPNFLPMPAA